jgi:predicted nucleic acid-binding protein
MDRIVSNASPLIYLAKADCLDILHQLALTTIIPEAVYREVVVEGKRLHQEDAYRVEQAIFQGRIQIKKVKRSYPIDIQVHPGEGEVISLAKETGINRVLIDDAKARLAAELAGLEPRGTLWLFLNAVKKGVLNFDQFLAALEKIIQSGFYLKEDVYLRIIQEARKT